MTPGVALILKPDIDFDTLLPLGRKLLGYSLAKEADGATIPLAPLARQLACLAGFKDQKAPATVRYARPYLGLLVVGFIVATDERDMVLILEATRGMGFVVTETTQRGVQAAIIVGTLAQWQQGVKLACQTSAILPVRQVFNAVYKQLAEQGLRSIFDGLRVSDQPDQTFLLLES